MKYTILIFVLLAYSESKSIQIETDTKPVLQDKPKLQLECNLKSLQGDPYPSIVIRWLGEMQKLTWDLKGDVKFERSFKLPPMQSHSYPSSSGLSGDSTTAKPFDPFENAPIIPDYYTVDDILDSFVKDCKKPF